MPFPPEASGRATVTACIIACDEAERLPDCLASVAFCDEVVVVDSGSRDGTVALARAAGAHVVEQPWLGFAGQRNVALDHAHGDWVLEIDADERVGDALQAEIEAFLAAPPERIDLCGLPMRDVFLGGLLGPSAKYPKYRHRMFRRGAHRHDEGRTVHEGIAPHGAVHPFEGDMTHLLAGSWREALADAWRYARLETQQLDLSQPPARILVGALARPPAKFAYRVVVDGGWRDGWRGLVKIALDCAGDAVAWLRLVGRRGERRTDAEDADGPPRDAAQAAAANAAAAANGRGPRIAAIAGGSRAATDATAWLMAAAAAGADVVLVAPGGADGGPSAGAAGGRSTLRVRATARGGPLALTRALDAEEQLSPLDHVVPFGRRARLLMRVVPDRFRGGAARRATAADDPVRVGAERDG
jgi:glycosyltransferase involved in cell wall biosynthesis